MATATKKAEKESPMQNPAKLITDLMAAFEAAPPELQEQMKKMFPSVAQPARPMTVEERLAMHRATARSDQGTANAQLIVMTMGSVTHSPGFEPDPPEKVSVMGEEAEAAWLLDWYEGRTGQSFEEFSRQYGDKNAQIAKETVETLENSANDISAAIPANLSAGDEQSYLSMASPSISAGVEE